MTGEIINLRKVRKDKMRVEKDKRAAENRAKFGMSKAEKQQVESGRDRIARLVDGARLSSYQDESG